MLKSKHCRLTLYAYLNDEIYNLFKLIPQVSNIKTKSGQMKYAFVAYWMPKVQHLVDNPELIKTPEELLQVKKKKWDERRKEYYRRRKINGPYRGLTVDLDKETLSILNNLPRNLVTNKTQAIRIAILEYYRPKIKQREEAKTHDSN